MTLPDLISSEDPFALVKSEIVNYPKENIPVPYLAGLIKINAGTINARIRREGILTHTQGRTNYVSKETALRFALLNEPAIRSWPSIYELAETYGINHKTFVYWCEKGKLRGMIDLTKTWRVDERELERIPKMVKSKDTPETFEKEGIIYFSLGRAARDAALILTKENTVDFRREHNRLFHRFYARAVNGLITAIKVEKTFYVPEQIYLKMIEPKEIKYEKRIKPARIRQDKTTESSVAESTNLEEKIMSLEKQNKAQESNEQEHPLEHLGISQAPSLSKQDNLEQQAHSIKIIRAADYGLSEQPLTRSRNQPESAKLESKGSLVYNPNAPLSVLECKKGKTVLYAGRTGIIEAVMDKGDRAYRPCIRVHFAEDSHHSPADIDLAVRNKFDRAK